MRGDKSEVKSDDDDDGGVNWILCFKDSWFYLFSADLHIKWTFFKNMLSFVGKNKKAKMNFSNLFWKLKTQ